MGAGAMEAIASVALAPIAPPLATRQGEVQGLSPWRGSKGQRPLALLASPDCRAPVGLGRPDAAFGDVGQAAHGVAGAACDSTRRRAAASFGPVTIRGAQAKASHIWAVWSG
jgi:hypothetical protein